jgi:Outer membrane protein beta-barrel domain
VRPASVVLPAAALILTAALAGAAPRRAASGAPASQDPQADLFGGYSYTQAGEASLHGGGLSGSFPFRDSLSFVADLSGHYGSFAGADLGQLGFMAGARWTWRTGRLSPFAEGLLGGVRTSASIDVAETSVSDADTDWGLALGGGADYQLGDRWAARGLVHLRLLRGEGAVDADPRIAVGVVYRFGR